MVWRGLGRVVGCNGLYASLGRASSKLMPCQTMVLCVLLLLIRTGDVSVKASTIDVDYSSVQGKESDGRASGEALRLVAFGSCNKPRRPQPLWEVIADMQPDLFMWTGDAVYTRASNVEALHEAIAIQNAHEDYQKFLEKKIPIIAAIDDHDYGVNDGGKDVPDREERMKAFVKFIENANDFLRQERESRGGGNDSHRDGLYSAHTYGKHPSKRVKIILLDTRTHRDEFAFTLPSWILRLPFRFPLFGPINTLLRLLSASGSAVFAKVFGAIPQEGKDILGEEQWRWLENQLEHSDASFHIIVSSIQVWTSNPFVESWGHFPSARKRLATLLQQSKPKGVVFISGDVHFAELIAGTSPQDVVEVTSSGMTHFARKTPFIGWAIGQVIKRFHSHRPNATDNFSTGLNFGAMEFYWPKGGDGREESGDANEEGGGDDDDDDAETSLRALASSSSCGEHLASVSLRVYDQNASVVLSSTTCSSVSETDWLALHRQRRLGMDLATFVVVVALVGAVVLLVAGIVYFRYCSTLRRSKDKEE
mmetsp:Transcript_11934/g.14180  ORF Transcript_11934/g.14180 Transcript_11934/m.14180 type:complete len:536 (+) Transcript_11934:79-1686(+)